ncbi:MAG TPA: acyloxyacyl hydrolase [Verrucomicrobiae bacterium]|nr:acyloxyacyl hydrolase [Verrucomicrobiae bacterium]
MIKGAARLIKERAAKREQALESWVNQHFRTKPITIDASFKAPRFKFAPPSGLHFQPINGSPTAPIKLIQLFRFIQTIPQSGLKAVGRMFCFALIAALLAAWILSEPFFRLKEKLSRRSKQNGNKPRPRRHPAGNGLGRNALFVTTWVTSAVWLRSVQAQSQPSLLDSPSVASTSKFTTIWQNGVGEGFKPGVQSVTLSSGAGHGVRILGSRESHDLALTSLTYGYMLGPVEGEGHWYRGDWELGAELFSGAQFSPTSDWLVGFTPHLRYNLATGTRWIPFVDAGAGVSATSIGPPDLSHYFEFNLQAAVGVRWFIRNSLALGVEARYLHMSCAGLSTPNLGLNNVNGMVSISWFF